MPLRRFAAAGLHALSVPTALSQQPVVDPQKRRVTGLDREYFTDFDDKVAQEIAYFADTEEAVTTGIVTDTSGSMRGLLNGSLQFRLTL